MKGFNERVCLNTITEAMEADTIQKNAARPAKPSEQGNYN
jgi:hypothetical protein